MNSPDKSLYTEIKQILDEARAKVYRTANFAMVSAYWEIGRRIVEFEQGGEARTEYGKGVLSEISKKLTSEYGKGFTLTNLRYFRLFYKVFPIHHALRDELTWTHYRLLLNVENEKARQYYIEECIQQNWSTRSLDRQISSFYYERLLSSQNTQLIKQEADTKTDKYFPLDFVKDPYVLEFLNLKPNTDFYEKDLEKALLSKLEEFLLGLGKGFSFVSRQKRISAEDDHFYVDLVFYNYILKCFVLIDLKLGKLSHQDIGQMDLYVRYFEENIKTETDNPTIGIILCSEKNETIVKYSILKESTNLFAAKYKLYLPTEEEFKKELENELLQLKLNN